MKAETKQAEQVERRPVQRKEAPRFVPLLERYELIRQADFRARARLAANNFEGLTL